ncbi:unnamed protein product [Clavelina lepadiformis]|uniref:PDZ domain-containing protein n=1 Tax=Clavelina lepadiformis TaxID=159417 RepID=A0ABP0GYV8_CLALP
MASRVHTSLTLFGSPPWGFRLSGGKEFNQPLVITRVTPGSISAKSGLTAGDVLISVNGQFVNEMTQDECEAKVKQAVGSLYLVVEKNAASVSVQPSGEVTVQGDRGIYDEVKPAGTSHNRTAQGFRPSTGPPTAPRPVRPPIINTSSTVPAFDPSMLKRSAAAKPGTMVMKGPGKSKVVHAQYNTPMGMYSNENIIDTVQAQAQSMGVSLPGVVDAESTPVNPDSAVFREVHRQQAAPKGKSTQSRSFKILQSNMDDDN